MPAPERRPIRLLFLVSEDWYFVSHRLALARAASKQGFEITVVTNASSKLSRLEAEGFRVVPFDIRRSSLVLHRQVQAILALRRVYRRERPDLVHHVAMKPVVYGTLAARLAGTPAIVNALGGLGYVFTSTRPLARALRPLLRLALRWSLSARNSLLILQNRDDLRLLVDGGLVRADRVRLIRGSGVDLHDFPAAPQPSAGVPLVVFPARLLLDKGIVEFVEAARELRRRGVGARFALVGDADPKNPACIDDERLRQWASECIVEVWGYRSDMAQVYREASIVCLPSYREGLPRSLLEAAASARPIVATDVPGCREVAIEGVTGLLVPPKSVKELADALQALLADPGLCARMGEAGRQLVERELSAAAVIGATLDAYRELLPLVTADQPSPGQACID